MKNFIWRHNIFWYRSFLWWSFHSKLKNVAIFIEKHKLYPVNLNKELLETWKGNANSKAEKSS